VPAVFLWHTCVSRRGSTREPENPKVRGRDGIANQSGSVVSSRDSWHPAAPIPRRSPSKTANHRGDYLFGHSLPTAIPGKLLHHPWSLVIVEFFSSPILSPRDFTFRPFFSITKVCPVSLNLLNAGDSFAGISSLTSCYLFSRTRDLIATF
jgi:hypothetical protein